MCTNIQALFIDMDGTLIETDIANSSAYNFALNKVLGKSIDLKETNLSRITGQIVKEFFPNIDNALYQKIKLIKNEVYNNFLPLTKVNSKILQTIIDNHDKTIVLVSRANYKRVVETLKHHNLLDYFDFFYCDEGKMKNKKYNKYFDAIQGLSISPQDVIVFENEDVEILNALAANIPSENIKQ